MSSAFLLGGGEGLGLTALGSTYVTKTDGSHVEGAYSLLEETFWAETTPLHSHTSAEESFYVLEGELEAWIDGDIRTAGPGSFLVVPGRVAHGLRRLSSSPVRMLTLISPPGFEQLFRAVVEQGEEDLLADPDRLIRLAAQHETEVLGDYPHP
jgi:mannose-6-phosphate isomerase-like protein (cupin superfamily)